jgi:hypothetical protein
LEVVELPCEVVGILAVVVVGGISTGSGLQAIRDEINRESSGFVFVFIVCFSFTSQMLMIF